MKANKEKEQKKEWKQMKKCERRNEWMKANKESNKRWKKKEKNFERFVKN